jgi:hypothetical protein
MSTAASKKSFAKGAAAAAAEERAIATGRSV